MPRIVVLGEALIDLFANEGADLDTATAFRPSPGGAPANVAAALGRLGASVGFIGRVGADAFGRLLRSTLERRGVDTRHLAADPRAPTMLALVASPGPDDPQFVLYNGANDLLRPADLPTDYLEAADVFVYGSVTLATRSRDAALAAAELARRSGSHVVFDVNLRPALWPDLRVARSRIDAALGSATIVKANGAELEFVTGTADIAEGARRLLDRGVELCCVSVGARGAHVANATTLEHVPAFEVATIDSTGSGDAFVAGLTLGILELDRPPAELGGEELARIVRFANACGAIVATQQGAMSADLTHAAVGELMRSQAR